MAKRVPPLSATKLAKFKPDAVKILELVDGAVPGLRVRLTPAGTRSWSLNIRANGKMRRFDVGRGLGLAEARLKAEETNTFKQLERLGHDIQLLWSEKESRHLDVSHRRPARRSAL